MLQISKWWRDKRKKMVSFININKKLSSAVLFAQTDCGFDHREPYDERIVSFKKREIAKHFGNLPDIRESEFSVPESVSEGYSNMFLTHIYFYLRIMSFGTPKSILEIGGGYGGLARIFKTLNPSIKYTIVDLPESLYFSESFMRLEDIMSVRFIEDILDLRKESFDLVINTFSFQEMPLKVIKMYIDFIQTEINIKDFYTCNYYKNHHAEIEQSYDGELPIDDKWNTVFKELNPPILMVDSPKNFQELYLRRFSA